jgi:hypothetical protein
VSYPAKEHGEVIGLAAMINSRLVAEARVARAASFVWICAGAAIGLVLCGLGCAIGFFGYSHVVSVRSAAELTAHALVDALQGAKLTTTVTGSMALAPNSELKLAVNQKVSLEDGTTVRLDPNSSVRIVGNLKVDVPQPSKQQLQLDTTSKSDELPFTNYTIFKEVDFGKGYVVTGWNYDLSDTVRPKSQYCYYKESLERGLSAKYTIAINNSPQRPSALSKVSFDFDGALTNCIWFSGY